MTTDRTHRFAWDGIAFDVPEDWELASNSFFKGVHDITMEDLKGVRLRLQWTRPSSEPDADAVRRRYHRLEKKLVKQSEAHVTVDGMPEDWAAFRYSMSDDRVLVLAYFTSHGPGTPFCFLQLHMTQEDTPGAEAVCRTLARTFAHREDGLADWMFYDVHLAVDRRFHLAGTALQAGRKLLQLQWRLRRLFVWTFSLADMVVRDHDLAEWCADYLNSFKGLKGPRFEVARDGRVVARRRRRHPLGHADEIGRMCWRYRVGYLHLPQRNQIVLWVFHYRNDSDSKVLGRGFRPDPDTLVTL